MATAPEVPARLGPCTTRDAEGCVWAFYYVNLKEIGRGGFGVVYSAERYYYEPRPGTDGRTYAIKFLRSPSGGAEKQELERRIKMEKLVHEKLVFNEDHVVTPIAFMKIPSGGDQTDLIVTEFCPGGDLFKHLKSLENPCMNEEDARDVILQVVKGVLAIHKAGFIHRDIKEANIFISFKENKPVYKIGDFGLAAESKQLNVMLCGTKRFMAPEMDGRCPYGPEVDVWSLGVLLFTLLMGQNQAPSALNISQGFSMEVRDLLVNMLVKEPSLRIGLDDVLTHPFITRTALGIGNRTHTSDSGIVSSSVGSSPQQFVPGLQRVTEEYQSLILSSRPVYSNHSLTRNVAANMPSSFKCKASSSSSVRLAEPLCTLRLRPSCKKHQFKVGTGLITSNGEVRLEFNISRRVLQNGVPCSVSVLEIMEISGNGLDVRIERNDGSETKTYSHANLSSNLWAKYNYAAKFVAIVRESTPKITFYTNKAMCRLMENGPPDGNFEAHFYSGSKFVYSASKGIAVTDSRSNASEHFSVNTLGVDRSHPHCELWRDFKSYHERAKRLEVQFESVAKADGQDLSVPFFPLTLGKRPSSLSAPQSKLASPSSYHNLRTINQNQLHATKESDSLMRTYSSPGPFSFTNLP